LAQAHSVTADDWLGTLGGGEATDRIKRLPDISIGFTKGTFADLMTATEGLQEASVLGAGGDHRRYGMTMNAQTEFDDSDHLTLRDVLARIPDLVDTYARTFGEYSRCLEARVTYRESTDDTVFEILAARHLGLPTAELLRERLLLPPWLDIVEGTRRSIFEPGRPVQTFELEHKTELDVKALPMLVHDANGTLFLVTQLPDDLRPSLLGSLFLTSYVMGMLVRYHPSLWFALIGRSKGRFHAPPSTRSNRCGRRSIS
jgi:YaaC-like Protein